MDVLKTKIKIKIKKKENRNKQKKNNKERDSARSVHTLQRVSWEQCCLLC